MSTGAPGQQHAGIQAPQALTSALASPSGDAESAGGGSGDAVKDEIVKQHVAMEVLRGTPELLPRAEAIDAGDANGAAEVDGDVDVSTKLEKVASRALAAKQKLALKASHGWAMVTLVRNVLVALWAPAVLIVNPTMSRWLPAMAAAHIFLVLAVGMQSFVRLRKMQMPGSQPVAVATMEPRKGAAPPGAWMRLAWASLVAAYVVSTHVAGVVAHYDAQCLKSIRCFRAWILTLGFCAGSIGQALGYVYAEWLAVRTGVRICHFLQAHTAFITDEDRGTTPLGPDKKND